MLIKLIKTSLHCRLCRRIAAYVLLSIVAIEAAILIPSYRNYERDLLLRLESVGRAEVTAMYGTGAQLRERDPLVLGGLHSRKPTSSLRGGRLYRPDGGLIGGFGAEPDLTLDGAGTAGRSKLRSGDGAYYDILLTPQETGLPFTVTARLDAGWIGPELAAFVWRILGLVLLISLFVCAVTMGILGRSILLPLLNLRRSLTAARDDPAHADSYTLPTTRDDEMGDVIRAVDGLLVRVSRTHRDELASMTAMANQAADAILAYDGAGRILYANPACLKLCGFESAQDMQAAHLPRFCFIQDGPTRTLMESLAEGTYSREAEMIAGGGRRVPVFLNAARPREDSEVSVQYYASITDISALREVQERLMSQNVELEAANRAKSEFLTNMSHELRTPLNAIIGFSDIMSSEMLGPLGNARYYEYSKDIHASGTHLLNIINDILDLSKVEAGKLELHESDIDVSELIEATLPLVRERAEANNLTLTTDVPHDLPDLYADPRALKQILANLISNAIKFTEPGGHVAITAAYEGGQIALCVVDTGIGIAKKDLPTVLQAFGQVDGGLTRRHQGTGLGLHLVQVLVELHGGAFEIDSEPGQGTRVTVRFPAVRTCAPGVARDSEERDPPPVRSVA